MNGKIAESITIRVGQGIMTIPRESYKSPVGENNKRDTSEKKTAFNNGELDS